MPICMVIDTWVTESASDDPGRPTRCLLNVVSHLFKNLKFITPLDDVRVVAFNGQYQSGKELVPPTRDYDTIVQTLNTIVITSHKAYDVSDVLSQLFAEHNEYCGPFGQPCCYLLLSFDELLLKSENCPDEEEKLGIPQYCQLHLLVLKASQPSSTPTSTYVRRDIDVSDTKQVKQEPFVMQPIKDKSFCNTSKKSHGMFDTAIITNPRPLLSHCQTVYTVDDLTGNDSEDLSRSMKSLAEDCYKPYRGFLALGHLTADISLYPAPTIYAIGMEKLELHVVPEALSIIGFVDYKLLPPLPILSRHVIISATATDMEPSLRLMLYESLRAKQLTAIIELSAEWYGLISCQRDMHNKQEISLLLSVLEPKGEIPWRYAENGQVVMDENPVISLKNTEKYRSSTFEPSYGPVGQSLPWMNSKLIQSNLTKLHRNLSQIGERRERLESLFTKIEKVIEVYHLANLHWHVLGLLEEKFRDKSLGEESLQLLDELIQRMKAREGYRNCL
eukprot:CFRG4302T1